MLATLLACARTACAASIPAHVHDAVDASSRPAADQLRDATRQPAQVMAFAGIEPGDKVADFMPGDGYYSRILCTLVGESGHVYAISIAANTKSDELRTPGCANVTSIELRATKRPAPELWSSSDDPGVVYEYWSHIAAAETFTATEPLDAILLAERYLDLRTTAFGSANPQLVNRALWSALKSGGVLVIEDSTTNAATIRRELLAAGFELFGTHEIRASQRLLIKFRKR